MQVRLMWRMLRTSSFAAIAAVVVVAAGPAAATPTPPATPSEPAVHAAGATTELTIEGHGFGHGRGMGQYGALGYAIDEGWTYEQILTHYYGGTIEGHVPTSTIMTVDMTARDGLDTIVAQADGELSVPSVRGVSCAAGSPCAVRIDRTGPGTFEVWQGSGCSG